jgi:hypothetical protein
MLSGRWPERWPYAGKVDTSKYTSPDPSAAT